GSALRFVLRLVEDLGSGVRGQGGGQSLAPGGGTGPGGQLHEHLADNLLREVRLPGGLREDEVTGDLALRVDDLDVEGLCAGGRKGDDDRAAEVESVGADRRGRHGDPGAAHV